LDHPSLQLQGPLPKPTECRQNSSAVYMLPFTCKKMRGIRRRKRKGLSLRLTDHVYSTFLVLLIMAETRLSARSVPTTLPKRSAGRYPHDVATCGRSLRQRATPPLSRSSLISSVKLVAIHFHDRHQFFISPSESTARDSDRSPLPQYDRPS